MRAEAHVGFARGDSDAKHSTGAPPNQLPLGTGDQESPRALRCDLDTVCTRRPGGDLLPILTYGRHVPTPRVAVSVGLLRPFFFRPIGYDHSTSFHLPRRPSLSHRCLPHYAPPSLTAQIATCAEAVNPTGNFHLSPRGCLKAGRVLDVPRRRVADIIRPGRCVRDAARREKVLWSCRLCFCTSARRGGGHL